MTISHRQIAIVGLVAALGCGGGQRPTVAPAPDRPEATIEAFLVAVNANDLERMASLWGDEDGPSNVTNKFSLEERRRRLTIMQSVLRSEERRVSRSDSTTPGRMVLTVDMRQGNRRFSVPFICVPARTGGWLIREVDINSAMQRRQQGQPGN